MDIVHIASELAPIAKVGGLGDVIYGLSKALVKKGHQVRIFLPRYDCIDYSLLENLSTHGHLSITESGKTIHNILWSAQFHGLELILIEPEHPEDYFNRGKIYGEKDDNDRFLYFCKAAMSALKNEPPDVIHLHDWPTAGCALFRKERSKIIFTIHNMQHQGVCALFNLERLGLKVDETELSDPNYEAINLLKGAIYYSDAITTVSPTYAKEILTPEGGFGLEAYLAKYKEKLTGILNGIDIEYWDPQTDSLLVKRYNAFEGKLENKRHVQKQLNLAPDEKKPLVAAITRLVAQKGPDLIQYGIEKTLEMGGQFALLGTTNDPEMRKQFQQLKSNSNLAIHLDFNERLSHLLYAASDMFLMPSIFEPCGLSQMIALRYGSVPLVRETGGLKDTIFDGKNGFTFDVPDNKGVASVLERAFATYQKSEWKTLVQNGMCTDLSWDKSADEYVELYLL